MILLIEPRRNEIGGDPVDQEFLEFANKLEERSKILAVNEMSTLPTVLATGYKFSAIVAKIDKKDDVHWAAIAKQFFMGVPLYSKGKITPDGYKQIEKPEEVESQRSE